MLYAGLFIIVALAFAAMFLVRRRKRAVALIDARRFGILNLKSSAATSMVAEDTAALTAVLGPPLQESGTPPQCDVLFLYCDIAADGRIQGSESGLRELIRDSGASVVVVASENGGDAYIAACKNKRYGRANLVMTMQRRGYVFPAFFVRLFSDMKAGVSMPVAWVKLAPQIPGREHVDCPATIFTCERGQIAFR
jgi:hypothetical protein